MSKFVQISTVREEDGDTIYALDDEGNVWSFWTGKSDEKKWKQIPMDRVHP